MSNIKIHSEYSAQGTNSKPNPMVLPVLEKLTGSEIYGLNHKITLVDIGCGKLRHLEICKKFAKNLILVDTKEQIERQQKFKGSITTMAEYVRKIKGPNIKIIETGTFAIQNNNADLILCVAVMDVVQKNIRSYLAKSAFNNLKINGYFVVIIPRNDSSILENCHDENRFEDGFIFKNRGHKDSTFFINYKDSSHLLKMFTNIGFDLLEDLSVYRQICFILKKP